MTITSNSTSPANPVPSPYADAKAAKWYTITPSDIAEAIRAYRSGDTLTVNALYLAARRRLAKYAEEAPNMDLDEAYSIASSAFMEALASLGPTEDNLDTKLFQRVKSITNGLAVEDRTVYTPGRTARRYLAVMEAHSKDETGHNRTTTETLRLAVGACKDGLHEMDVDTLLATHRALHSHLESESTHSVGLVNETGDDLGTFDIPTPDTTPTYDTYHLVHHHLLPLLSDRDRLVILLTYGFTEIPDVVQDLMVSLGLHLGEPMASRQVAEVLGVNGYGYEKLGHVTVTRVIKAALDTFRTYLDEDEAREAA